MAARTRITDSTVMLPQYRNSHNGQLTDVPCFHTSRDVHDLISHRPSRHANNPQGWVYVKLRDPQETPKAPSPTTETVVVLKWGAMGYASTGFKQIPNKPWWNHMMRQPRQAFVAWGDRNGTVFNNERSLVRRSGARGVVYSRYPVFSDRTGQVINYRVKVVLVEFQLLTKQPDRGETLRYKVDTLHYSSGETISLYGRDNAWQLLVNVAKSGFERSCNAEASARKLASWSNWFFDQKARFDKGYHQFNTACRGIGWLQALDNVKEAWQLPIALRAYSSMFPEVPPFDAVFDASDERQPEEIALHPVERSMLKQGRREELLKLMAEGDIYRSRHATHLIMPCYEGSSGSMEGALMDAYLQRRPHRREQFEQWMTDYVYMTDGFRNYTGD